MRTEIVIDRATGEKMAVEVVSYNESLQIDPGASLKQGDMVHIVKSLLGRKKDVRIAEVKSVLKDGLTIKIAGKWSPFFVSSDEEIFVA